MAEMILEQPTTKSTMDEHREALETALREQFPGGLMRSQWEGDVLQLSGPGAQGTIALDGGRLVGRAELSPPASLMRGLVEEKIQAVLKKAVG